VAVLVSLHREQHVEQHPLRDELVGLLRRASGGPDQLEDLAHAAAALAADRRLTPGGEAVHHHQQQVAVGEQPGVGGAQPFPVVLALGVERPVGQHLVERVLDAVGGALEDGEEQVELGAEHPHDVRLRDAGLASHVVGAGADVPRAGERPDRGPEDLLAALVGAHAGDRCGLLGSHG